MNQLKLHWQVRIAAALAAARAWPASLAATGLTLVSNHTADFGRIAGLRLENWAAA